MITTTELDCAGKVRLGELAPGTAERLASLAGEWLEFSPEEEAVVVRHTQPGGTTALQAVPAEMIAFLDCLSAPEREALPGGSLLVRDRAGVVLRLLVEHGDLRIQWPREDWSRTEPVDLEAALAVVDPYSARISGTASFTGPAGAETRLVELVERFEGLYPEGDLRVARAGETVRAALRDVNVGPEQLLARLLHLAEPAASLDADLEVSSFVAGTHDRDFRLTVRAGDTKAARPALWREG